MEFRRFFSDSDYRGTLPATTSRCRLEQVNTTANEGPNQGGGPVIPRYSLFAGLLTASVLAGCRAAGQVRDPEYADVVRATALAAASPQRAADAVLPGPQIESPGPVEAYVALALAQNPEIQAARKRVDALANRVPQAASLPDPTLGVTVFPEPVQTAAGEQEISLAAGQRIPWFGKLRTRAAAAEAETDIARAQLAAVELAVIEKVKRAYYELYFLQKAVGITEQDRKLLLDLVRVAESKYRTGTVSQQDVLRAQVEVSSVDDQLIRLRQQLAGSQAELARLLHVSPDTKLRALDELPPDQIPGNLDRLYQRAVQARPELHAQLAAVRRDRQSVELARLEYFPDLAAGVTWIATADSGISPVADGRDPVLLGMSVNLPIYRKKLEAGVREAEAQAVSSARRYDSLKDETTEEVKDLFVRATSQYELLRLFRDDILPKSEQTLEVSRTAYQVGDVDFLQLIDNWQQLLRFRITLYRLESQLRQTLAALERVLGGQLPTEGEAQPLPALPENKEARPEQSPPIPLVFPLEPQPANS